MESILLITEVFLKHLGFLGSQFEKPTELRYIMPFYRAVSRILNSSLIKFGFFFFSYHFLKFKYKVIFPRRTFKNEDLYVGPCFSVSPQWGLLSPSLAFLCGKYEEDDVDFPDLSQMALGLSW